MAEIAARVDPIYYGPDRGEARAPYYWATAALLIALMVVPWNVGWRLTIFSHILLEVIATVLAFVMGCLALVRHFSHSSGRFLLIGTGFLGTAIFDTIHTVVSITDFGAELPSTYERVSLWSWIASRIFLGMLMLIAAIRVGPTRVDEHGREVVEEVPIFTSVGLLVILCLVIFWTAPLPGFIYRNFLVPRPLELVPALLFLLAFVILYRNGVWRRHAFSHWLMLSLLINFAVDGLFLVFSDRLFDSQSVMAHLLKIAAYACVFIGLAASLRGLVRQAEDASAALETVNRTLEQEVEERRQAVAQLRMSELRLAEAQRLARIGHWELEPESERVMISTELSTLLGLPIRPNRLTLSELMELVAAKDREALEAALHDARENAAPFDLEIQVRGPNGQPIRLYVLANVIGDETGKAIRLWGTGQDVTERYRNEEQLRAVAVRLEASNRELQDFAYIASHDLQEPLRKIIAFSDRLSMKSGDALDDTGKDYLQRIQHAAWRMQVLIEDLLTLSRVTTRGQPFTNVDLQEVVAGVASDLEARLEETQGRLEVGTLPVLEADPLQMRQLFQNLIGNALKFHKPDTPPFVRVRLVDEEPGSLSTRWKIVVEDNGIGFDMKYADRIFQPFQRLHGRSSAYTGTGMGLAICRKIIERHHGTIWATSKPGEGTQFWITLPKIQLT